MDRGIEEYKKKYRRVGKYLDEILEGTSRYEIYKILPFNRFVANFNFYHTQGWDYVIDDAIENYKTGNYIV